MGDGVQIFDLLRLVVFAACGVILYTTYRAGRMPGTPPGHRARLFGVAVVFVLYVAGTEVEHLGDYANWRLYVGLIASVSSAWGSWAYFKYENPPSIRPRVE
jgi:hypothetical protein